MVSGTAPYFQKLHPCVGCIPERQEKSGAVGFNDYADLFARYPDRVARFLTGDGTDSQEREYR